MDTNQTDAPPRWFLRGWAAFLWAFLICVVGVGLDGYLRFTLANSLADRVAFAFYSGLLLGGFIFVALVAWVQGGLLLLLNCFNLKRRWWFPLSLLPAVVVFYDLIYSSLIESSPQGDRAAFERAVGVPFPADARLVLVQRGMGMQDHRSLWLFEGNPAELDQLIAARGWEVIEGDPQQAADIGFRRAKEYFEQTAPWQVDTLYFWMSDKEATEPPFGWNYLLADKERKRWAVWVAD